MMTKPEQSFRAQSVVKVHENAGINRALNVVRPRWGQFTDVVSLTECTTYLSPNQMSLQHYLSLSWVSSVELYCLMGKKLFGQGWERDLFVYWLKISSY